MSSNYRLNVDARKIYGTLSNFIKIGKDFCLIVKIKYLYNAIYYAMVINNFTLTFRAEEFIRNQE